MIAFKINIQVTDFPSKRAYTRAMKSVHEKMGEHWHKKILPMHFNEAARSKYGHQPRSEKYQKNKQRMANRRWRTKAGETVKRGGKVDNVFTGAMERMLKESKSIKAYPTRATVRMSGPRYISMRPYKSGQPDKHREVTGTTPNERAALAKVADVELTKQLAKTGENKTFRG